MIGRVVAWAVVLLLAVGLFKLASHTGNPWDFSSKVKTIHPSAEAVYIPGCRDKPGCEF